jgi:phosphoenolpyruvate---glycerone phosphotransferase subunit DhaL
MSAFPTAGGARLVQALVQAIQEHAQELSDIDGLTGDGDHGVNMAKGFALAGAQLTGEQDLATSLQALGSVLLNEIGGAMGPLYGSFFRAMARAARGRASIDAATFSAMLHGAQDKVCEVGGAVVGDKTLLDTLAPATAAFDAAVAQGADFGAALTALQAAAERGRDSTKDLVAKKGRASRLGERSRGVLDAGATSCCLLLCTMAEHMRAGLV